MMEEKTENKRKIPAAVIIAAALAAIWLLIEILSYALALPTAPTMMGEDFCQTENDGDVYEITEQKTLRFSEKCGAIETVSFIAKGNQDSVVTVKIEGYDPSDSGALITYKKEQFAVGTEDGIKNTVRVDIPKGAGRLFITFEYDDIDYAVEKIVFNDKSSVHFNFSRLLIMWGIFAAFALIKHFKLFTVIFDPKNRNHQASALALCLICVLVAMMLTNLLCPYRSETRAYPFEYGVNYYNPYEQQFDAFMKGQLHIDYEPSEGLLELEDPYDPAQRENVYYLWDRAFYDGKYYSYFGIGPIITVYAPYYFITGELPAYDTVSTVFAVMTALFLSMAVVKWASMYTKKLPLPLLWTGTLGTVFASQIFLAMRGHSRFYYVASIAGMAFLSAFIWLFLCGISGSVGILLVETEPPKWKRPLIYTLAAIAYGLCFLSRYNMALLAAFFIVPTLIFAIVSEKKDGKRRFRQFSRVVPELLALAIPVAAAIGFQLWFNYARFDSILEFGTTYQLTVSDVSQNRLRLSDLPYAIFHYFAQPLSISADFPFVSLFYTKLNGYGHYVYIDTGMGLMTVPMMWSTFAAPFVFAAKKVKIERKITLGATIFGLVAVALLDFCLGGVIFRYTFDLTIVGAFASMAIIFTLCDVEEIESDTVAVTRIRAATVALILVSVMLCLLLAFSLNGNLTHYPSEVYVWFRNLFVW